MGSVSDDRQSEGRMVLAKAENAFVVDDGKIPQEGRALELVPEEGHGFWLSQVSPGAQRAGRWESGYLWEVAQLRFEGVSLQGLLEQ